MVFDGENNGDTLSNLQVEYNFSSQEFDYYQPGTISSYVWWSPVNNNIPTSLFNPPLDNTAPLTTTSNNGDIVGMWDLKIQLKPSIASYNFTA